jgi:hypothetical protein
MSLNELITEHIHLNLLLPEDIFSPRHSCAPMPDLLDDIFACLRNIGNEMAQMIGGTSFPQMGIE